MIRTALVTLALVFAAASLGSCQRNTGEAVSEVHVLVDLSETWFNPDSRDHNKAVLTEIGEGIVRYAKQTQPPVAVQYRVIGTVSLGRLLLCDAVFDPVQRPKKAKRPDYLVTTVRGLTAYLVTDCPIKVTNERPEGMTEITQAINGSAKAMSAPAKGRFMIIASDLLEESVADQQTPEALDGVRVLLIYRPVEEDLRHPAQLTARVNGWTERLKTAGATEVRTVPDDGLKASAIASFLFQQ